MKCDECHKNPNFAKSANEWTKDQGHALCRDCHKKNNGPTKCTKLPHQKAQKETGRLLSSFLSFLIKKAIPSRGGFFFFSLWPLNRNGKANRGGG